MKKMIGLSCLIISSIAIGQSNEASLPDEVQAFIEQREACDHFRGEPVEPDGWRDLYEERLQQVTKAIKQHCTGTDQALIMLKQKYKDHKAIIQALEDFEDEIGL